MVMMPAMLLAVEFEGSLLWHVARAAIVVLSLASLLPLRRVMMGPSLADRSIGLDVLLANAVAIMALFSILHQTDRYVPTILLLILLGFTSSVAFSRFLETGQVFESESTDDDAAQKPAEDALE